MSGTKQLEYRPKAALTNEKKAIIDRCKLGVSVKEMHSCDELFCQKKLTYNKHVSVKLSEGFASFLERIKVATKTFGKEA